MQVHLKNGYQNRVDAARRGKLFNFLVVDYVHSDIVAVFHLKLGYLVLLLSCRLIVVKNKP